MELKQSDLELMIQEQKDLQKEIETLNENIKRKDEVMIGLYEIIVGTKDVELLKKAEKVMLKANFGDKVEGGI